MDLFPLLANCCFSNTAAPSMSMDIPFSNCIRRAFRHSKALVTMEKETMHNCLIDGFILAMPWLFQPSQTVVRFTSCSRCGVCLCGRKNQNREPGPFWVVNALAAHSIVVVVWPLYTYMGVNLISTAQEQS